MGSKFPTPPPSHNAWENIVLPPPPPPKRYDRGDVVGGVVVCCRCLRPRPRHSTNPCGKCINAMLADQPPQPEYQI